VIQLKDAIEFGTNLELKIEQSQSKSMLAVLIVYSSGEMR